MDKKEFLKQAKAKYKNQLEVGKVFVSEMNFIFNDKLILRVWFNTETKEYSHRWNSSLTLPIIEQQKIERALGRYTSNDDVEYPEIIKSLRKALKVNPDAMVDYVDGITMWEKVELEFTVKTFCELIGLRTE